jgi:hypothetical protein
MKQRSAILGSAHERFMTARIARLLSHALPLTLFCGDALAWGLQTHLFFAHYVLAALPFADPELRSVAKKLPRMVLAGACLPDLGIVGMLLGTPAFRRAHLWSTLRRVATAPRNETEQALAIGYASHLLSDVVAHNLFVPEYERRFGRTGMIAHLAAEWAMDQHLRAELRCDPAPLVREFAREATDFVCRALPCSRKLAAHALGILARGDAALRASPLPAVCRAVLGTRRFDKYVHRTASSLGALELALGGGLQDWSGLDPEGSGGDQGAEGGAGEHVARIVQAKHHA